MLTIVGRSFLSGTQQLYAHVWGPMETASVERALLLEAATGLVEIADRFWSAGAADPGTYPVEAHHGLAQIEGNSFWFAHRNSVINAVLGLFPPVGTIADIGGGNGFVSWNLTRRGYSCIVIEPGDDAANNAHDRGLTVVKAPFNRMLFQQGSLAAVGLFDVIEHIVDEQNFLTDCMTALAPGGNIYVTAPAFQFLWSSDDVYAKHQRRYNRMSLTNALTGAGFEVLFVSYFFSLLAPPLFFLRTLPSVLGFRNVATSHDALKHHGRAGGGFAEAVRRVLAFERIAIAKGAKLPVGTSLIAVARKRVA